MGAKQASQEKPAIWVCLKIGESVEWFFLSEIPMKFQDLQTGTRDGPLLSGPQVFAWSLGPRPVQRNPLSSKSSSPKVRLCSGNRGKGGPFVIRVGKRLPTPLSEQIVIGKIIDMADMVAIPTM